MPDLSDLWRYDQPPDQAPLAGMGRRQELSSYSPSLRDMLARALLGDSPSLARENFVTGLVGSKGLGSTNIGLADLTPAGIPMALNEAYRAGDPQGAALAVAPFGAAARGITPVRQGIRAYHGSPHDFDRFDLSRIGTGEGAQAYGHGLYFAENPATAQDYKKKLSGVFGRGVDNDLIRSASGDLPLTAEHMGVLRHFAGEGNLSAADAAKRVQWRFPELRDADQMSGVGSVHRGLMAAVEQTRTAGKGRMYEVNINAKPEQFLDWDKPMTAQPKAFEPYAAEAAYQTGKNPEWLPMADAIPVLGNRRATQFGSTSRTQGAAALTNEMREAGIPGLRYLDQGSRNTDVFSVKLGKPGSNEFAVTGPGGETRQVFGNRAEAQAMAEAENAKLRTSNYVLFDDKLIDILRKYAIPGMVGAGGAAAIPALSDGPQ